MRIAFIGHGKVGGALAASLARTGHDVVIADTGRGVSADDSGASPGPSVQPASEAIRGAQVVFLTTPFNVTEAILAVHADALAGKVVVDCTNPVGPGMTHGLKSERAGSEVLQAAVPQARVVKAFSIYGYENLADNVYPGSPATPAMFFCGNDAGAKETVRGLIVDLGWDPLDVGDLQQALHLEHMTLLWIRMVRVSGSSPRIVWAALRDRAHAGSKSA